MGNGRGTRSEADLREGARTIAYEFTMLLVGVFALNGFAAGPIKNLVLEVVLLHARSLRDFLGERGHADDVLVVDYVPAPPATMPYVSSEAVKTRLDRLLAHCSYQR
jgi:hypothetical protein